MFACLDNEEFVM